MAEPSFGQHLARLREAAGLTRYQLAKDAGLAAIQIHRIEGGQVPSWSTACRIADALGVDIGAFRGPIRIAPVRIVPASCGHPIDSGHPIDGGTRP
jgi:transcriptional regulator with XRE-family HTH domain